MGQNQLNPVELTSLLQSYSNLLSLTLEVDHRSAECHLTLNLSQDHNLIAEQISIEFIGVSGLSLDRVGGGLIQLLMLTVEDIRSRQLDRLNYRIYDAEDESLSFECRKWVIHETP